MQESDIKVLLEKQRSFYRSGITLPLQFRRSALEKIASLVRENEEEIVGALREDLGKSASESYLCEIGMVLSEISFLKRNLEKFVRPKRVPTPLAQFPARSYRQPVPMGNVLIVSPWNYPLLLTLGPLADAVAAGNTAVLKPSAYSPTASKLLSRLVGQTFAQEYIAIVEGGREENQALLDQKFDLVFFTGSQTVGKEVLRRCAEHLTPAVLELGGKSPCIVDSSAEISLAARRIVFGKFLNCGQTCVAPDYVLCTRKLMPEFTEAVIQQIRVQFGNTPLDSPDYGKIICRKHFDRLCGLLQRERIIFGGETDPEQLRIAPTVMTGVTRDDPVMQQEIFGPILPILTYDDFDACLDELKNGPRPLALYLFSHNRAHIRRVNMEMNFGGGCINDVVVHLATTAMGFGGVGESGMGTYHGEAGFRTFSHEKSMLDRKTWLDLPIRYQPYTEGKMRAVRKFMK